jgi:hypothetical protein
MIINKKIIIAPLMTIFLMFGCHYFKTDVNKYAVNVKFEGSANGEKLESVSAIIGSDKFWWTSFEAGEEKTINLFSDKNAVNNLTLLYTFGGNQRTWESADFAENADYRINLTVDSAGNIAENSCKLPCQ